LKLSHFHQLLQDEFGAAFAQVLLRDFRLQQFQDQTAEELIAAGVDPKLIWLELCKQQAVPKERWTGIPVKKRHAE
jgi:hypothetical protein